VEYARADAGGMLSSVPVYAAGLAIALIDEQLAWYHGIALALVVTGLLLVNRGQAHSGEHKCR
jgi:drug/metabolite transporter (DMT)-like permease